MNTRVLQGQQLLTMRCLTLSEHKPRTRKSHLRSSEPPTLSRRLRTRTDRATTPTRVYRRGQVERRLSSRSATRRMRVCLYSLRTRRTSSCGARELWTTCVGQHSDRGLSLSLCSMGSLPLASHGCNSPMWMEQKLGICPSCLGLALSTTSRKGCTTGAFNWPVDPWEIDSRCGDFCSWTTKADRRQSNLVESADFRNSGSARP